MGSQGQDSTRVSGLGMVGARFCFSASTAPPAGAELSELAHPSSPSTTSRRRQSCCRRWPRLLLLFFSVPELLLRVASRSPPTKLKRPPAAFVNVVAVAVVTPPLSLALARAGMGYGFRG